MIKEISREQMLNGFGHPVACCMFDVANRAFKCDMWPWIYDEIGSIGYLAYEKEEWVGQMIFLPKKYARRIRLSTCRTNERLDTTLLVQCLYIHNVHRNQRLASDMINKVIDFCKSKDFNRIEVGTYNRPSAKDWFESISFLPFRKFGFTINEEERSHEFNSEEKMCYLNL